ncbi:MAG: PAS domain-containing protein, partial [Alphaproteobacteria bacterium]
MLDSSRIAEPLLRKCHDYWRSKCPPDGPPARRDIDPLEMVEFLPNVILVNTASVVGDFTFRLFGTGAVFGFGEDRTGKRFGDLGAMAKFDEAIESYWHCYRDVRPV